MIFVPSKTEYLKCTSFLGNRYIYSMALLYTEKTMELQPVYVGY